MKRTAQCCCGAITLEVAEEPMQHSICHCNNCKKRTGSAFGLSAYFHRDTVKFVSGTPSCYQLTNPNDGADQKRYFCSNCGTTLYWSVSSLPEFIGIAGGCFINQALAKPTHSASHSNKYSWLEVPSDIETNG